MKKRLLEDLKEAMKEKNEIKKNAINNYKKSQKYCKDILEKRRDKFYKEFVEE